MLRKLLILIFILTCLVPLGLALGYSAGYSLGLTGLLSDGFTLSYWAGLFRGEFLSAILYSAWVAAASTFLGLSLALALLLLARKMFRNSTLYAALFLPLSIPPIVLGFIVFQLYSPSGFFSRLAYQMGLVGGTQAFPVVVQDGLGLGIIIAHVFLVFPFFLLVLLNVFEHEKLDDLTTVAASVGAGKGKILLHVQLPVLLRGIFPILALYFIFFMGAYDIPLLLGSSSPQMISVLILEKLQRYNLANIPVAHAMAVWYALLCMATIAWLFSRRRSQHMQEEAA